MELDISQLEGVGPVTVKKLKEFGVTSLFDICVRGSREISEITATAKNKSRCLGVQCTKDTRR